MDTSQAVEAVLTSLRSTTTNEQKNILTSIMAIYQETTQWPTMRTMMIRFSRDRVDIYKLLEPLGGGVVTIRGYGPQESVELQFPGLLLTEFGLRIERIFAKMIGYLKVISLHNPEVQVIPSADLRVPCEISSTEFPLVYWALQVTHFLNAGGTGPDNWDVQLPYDIDDLPRVGERRPYVLEKAFAYYLPGLPLHEAQQQQYRNYVTRREQTQGDFWFVRDADLRRWLASDWQEAQSAIAASGYRSCVILCGSILEGALLDVLGEDKDRAQADLQSIEFRGTLPRELNTWELSQLLKVAQKWQILDATDYKACDLLKDFRNFVHLGRQQRLSQEVTPAAAQIAVSAVQLCLRALSTRARRQLQSAT